MRSKRFPSSASPIALYPAETTPACPPSEVNPENDVTTDPPSPASAQRPLDREHLTLNEAAEWLRCSTRTLQRLLEDGTGPPVIRLSQRRLIFRMADLRAWLSRRCRGGGAQPRGAGRHASKTPQPRRRAPPKQDGRGATP
jgi:predicted DNA-binding transcriptional regulator AlpA